MVSHLCESLCLYHRVRGKVMKGRRWLLGAFGVFLILLVVWIVMANLLSGAYAGGFPFSLRLGSQLRSDYSAEEGDRLGAFRLSIVGDAMQDEGMSPEEAEDQSKAVKNVLESPIPTATARDFEGEKPFTATPTFTPIPTDTPTPTMTYTPTRTPRPTKTPTKKPTRKPNSTNTPLPPSDTKAPQIASVRDMIPPPGDVVLCSDMIGVYDLEVVDPAFSSGIEWIKLKYQDPVSKNWVISSPFYPPPPVGWVVGDEWRDCYTIYIDVNISGSCGSECDFTLYAWVKDKVGKELKKNLGVYEAPDVCP